MEGVEDGAELGRGFWATGSRLNTDRTLGGAGGGPRVSPWAGTAHGVLQAVNTFEHHEGIIRGTRRPERNMLRTITGDFAKLDRNTLSTLNQVLA